MLTRLKLAAALRGQNKFDEADSLLDELLGHRSLRTSRRSSKRACCWKPKPRPAKATGRPRCQHWEDLDQATGAPATATGGLLRRLVSRGLGPLQAEKNAKARQALMGVMRLSPNVGGPEMKAKYQGLLARLK